MHQEHQVRAYCTILEYVVSTCSHVTHAVGAWHVHHPRFGKLPRYPNQVDSVLFLESASVIDVCTATPLVLNLSNLDTGSAIVSGTMGHCAPRKTYKDTISCRVRDPSCRVERKAARRGVLVGLSTVPVLDSYASTGTPPAQFERFVSAESGFMFEYPVEWTVAIVRSALAQAPKNLNAATTHTDAVNLCVCLAKLATNRCVLCSLHCVWTRQSERTLS